MKPIKKLLAALFILQLPAMLWLLPYAWHAWVPDFSEERHMPWWFMPACVSTFALGVASIMLCWITIGIIASKKKTS